jgi:hypothetical protein
VKVTILTLGALLAATTLFAQQAATPLSTLVWTQAAPTLAAAQGYTYSVYVDKNPRVDIPTVTCSGTATPFTCRAPVIAMTPGSHAIQMTASSIVNDVRGESPKSAQLDVVMIIAPTTPTNVRLE